MLNNSQFLLYCFSYISVFDPWSQMKRSNFMNVINNLKNVTMSSTSLYFTLQRGKSQPCNNSSIILARSWFRTLKIGKTRVTVDFSSLLYYTLDNLKPSKAQNRFKDLLYFVNHNTTEIPSIDIANWKLSSPIHFLARFFIWRTCKKNSRSHKKKKKSAKKKRKLIKKICLHQN